MRKILILYPHGLGDCILATPALREYKKETGNYIAFAMMERLKSSEIFKHNPWIDEELYMLPDPWNDIDNTGKRIGFEGCWSKGTLFASSNGFHECILIKHSSSGNKILETMEQLLKNKSLSNPRCDVYISSKDQEKAYEHMPSKPYAFIHDTTDLSSWKNLPKYFAENYLYLIYGIENFYVVDRPIRHDSININIQFYILQRAEKVFLIDSVYYHACCALNKEVNYAYFSKGRGDYTRVRHIVPPKELIIDEQYVDMVLKSRDYISCTLPGSQPTYAQ